MSLALSLRSESLKLKRTPSVWVCMLAAAIGPFMRFLENIDEVAHRPKAMPWIQHFTEGRDAINIALLPFYVMLVSTLLMQVEYRDKTWKQVLTSPQRMIDIFLAKFMALQFMILLFFVSYNLFLIIGAIGTEIIYPASYDGPVDYRQILLLNTQTWILVQGLATIQFWLALRFKNFIVPLAVGIAMWFAAPMMIFEFKLKAVEYHPYAYTMFAVMKDRLADLVTYQWRSVIIAVLFLVIAFAEFRVRKMKS
jgi:hypothetical protein